MTMHASEQGREAQKVEIIAEDEILEISGEPKVVVDEDLIDASNEPRATKAQILILQQETTDTTERMICTAALESANPSVREVAQAACAQLWEARRARLRARRDQDYQLAKLDIYKDDDPEEPSEEELRVGDLTGVLEILDSTPIGPRKANGTLPGTPVASATLIEFPCPLCHRPIIGDRDLGILRVPRHQIAVPVFPYGFAMPAHLVRCPASGAPLTESCNRKHREAPCGDPQCWRLPTEEPRPFSEDTAGEESADDRAPIGYPRYPPGTQTNDAACGTDDMNGLDDGGELDSTVVDGCQVPSDGWQPELTVTGAKAFPDPEIGAADDPAGDS